MTRLVRPHPLPQHGGGGLDEGAHGPHTLEAADAEEKVFQDLGTPGGVLDFGVELHPVEPPLGVTDSPGGAGVAAADDLEPRGGLLHHVAVAHPHGLGVAQAVEQIVAVADAKGLAAVFPGLGRHYPAPQQVAQELDAVADAQDRHPQFQDLRVEARGIGLVDAPRPPGEDDALGVKLADLLHGHEVGVNLAVDLEFPNPPGDQLGVLGAEIQDQDFLLMGVMLCGGRLHNGQTPEIASL